MVDIDWRFDTFSRQDWILLLLYEFLKPTQGANLGKCCDRHFTVLQCMHLLSLCGQTGSGTL